MARDLFAPGEFIEVFVDTPLEECMRRDPKGLLQEGASGQIANFTGISSAYEPPEDPELHLKTLGDEPERLALQIEAFLNKR